VFGQLLDNPENPVNFEVLGFSENSQSPISGEQNRTRSFFGNDEGESVMSRKSRSGPEHLAHSLNTSGIERRHGHSFPDTCELLRGKAKQLICQQHVGNNQLIRKPEKGLEEAGLSKVNQTRAIANDDAHQPVP